MTCEKAYNQALGYLSRSPKTILQMKQYLTGKGYDQAIIEQVIGRLLSYSFLDDDAFTRQFIDSRVRSKPKSIFALKYELKQKGIPAELAQKHLLSYNDEDLALKAIQPKIKSWRQLEESARKKKVMNYLRYRGFDYSVCQVIWERVLMES